MTNTSEPPNPISLLPCPFCGGNNISVHMRHHRPDIDCLDCDTITTFYVKDHAKESAITQWNTRHAATPDPSSIRKAAQELRRRWPLDWCTDEDAEECVRLVLAHAHPTPDSDVQQMVEALKLMDAYLYAVAPESNERQIVLRALGHQTAGEGIETGLQPVPDNNAPSPASVFGSEIPDNKCPDCGATMIEVCSGLEINARGEAAGLCRHSDYCEKPTKPVSVSLEKCAKAAMDTLCADEVTPFCYEISKAVLDAANVEYTE